MKEESLSADGGWGLWITWVLASTVAFGVGGRLGVALSPSKDGIVIGYLAVTAALILAGVLQWLVLRRLIADTGWWVLVSVVAVAIVGVLVFGLGLINRDVGWVFGVVLGWVVLGALQWLVGVVPSPWTVFGLGFKRLKPASFRS